MSLYNTPKKHQKQLPCYIARTNEKAHEMKTEFKKAEQGLLRSIKRETNIDTQIWAARSIANVFDVLRLEYPRTEKTEAPSFTKNFLQEQTQNLQKE